MTFISCNRQVYIVATVDFAINAFLLNHLKALSKRFDVTVIVNTDDSDFLLKQGVDVKVIPLNISRNIHIFSDIRCLVRLVSIFIKFHPSAVHSITPKAGLLAMLAASIACVPCRVHTFTGQVWVNNHGLKRWFYKKVDRAIVFLSTQVFCDSASQGIFLQKEKIIKENAISVIGGASISGVNLSRFHPQADQVLDNHFLQPDSQSHFNFLFVGRITQDKGIFDLIKAFVGINRENPQVNLWIVGPDEEGIRAQIDSKFPDLKSVYWFGSSATPEVFMAKADALVLPSYREGFGTVIIEAAACKTPTIAYRIDGVIDAIDEGLSGTLVKKGDSKALELAMKSMMLNPDRTSQMGEYAYQRVVRLFCAKRITDSWIELSESIIPVDKI